MRAPELRSRSQKLQHNTRTIGRTSAASNARVPLVELRLDESTAVEDHIPVVLARTRPGGVGPEVRGLRSLGRQSTRDLQVSVAALAITGRAFAFRPRLDEGFGAMTKETRMKWEWIGLVTFAAGCAGAPVNEALGIVDVQVDQTPTRLQVTGFNAAGNPIAVVDVKSGNYTSTLNDELAGEVDGRQVTIHYKDEQYSFDNFNQPAGTINEIHVTPRP